MVDTIGFPLYNNAPVTLSPPPAGDSSSASVSMANPVSFYTSADTVQISAANDNTAKTPAKPEKGKPEQLEKNSGTSEVGKKDVPAANDEEFEVHEPAADEPPEGSTETVSTSKNLVNIAVFHTNDIHGMEDRLPGHSLLITELKEANPQAILVDAGDIAYSAQEIEGDPYAPAVQFLNDNGYYAIVPGNHDFQWGKEATVNDFFAKLKPQVLCANVLDRDTGASLAGAKPFVIKDVEGVKVALFGITTTRMATNEHPDIGNDLIAFGEVETLQRDVALARNEGAQVFIAILHKGIKGLSEIKKIAEKVPELDLIVSGHDHEVVKTSYRTGPMPHRTYIVEAGCYGNYVGSVNLVFDKDQQAVVKGSMKAYPSKKYVIAARTEDGD